jgi:hypothetical protein
MTKENQYFNHWSVVSIFFISVVVIALQLVLMRAISVSHYYHFTYMVISTALLGFGASGTILALWFPKFSRNFPFWNLLFLFLFLVSVPITYLAAQHLPIDTQYILYSRHQLFLLITYNFLMMIPFLFGGLVISFMLAYFKKEVPVLYGANLIGSGAGGMAALGLMMMMPAQQLPLVITPFSLIALLAFLISMGKQSGRFTFYAGSMAVTALFVSFAAVSVDPPENIDPYKDLSHFRQLELQGDAKSIISRYGPRSQIDVFQSPTFHYTLFAGPQAMTMPPPQLAILMDGQVVAPLFTIDHPSEAEILDFTPQSLPYQLLENPHVLLLGETGGVNVWLARRMGAEKITVVQTNPQLIRLIREDLAELGGGVYSGDQIELINMDPRLYIEQTDQSYDLIQLVTGEATASGTGGLQGLNEDYLLTTDAVHTALARLNENGLISITRGIQSPPRDNIKLLSLFIDAANITGIQPEQHLLVSRNYLAANILLSKAPVGPGLINQFYEISTELQLDKEYYPGIRTEEIDQINRIEGPEGVNFSYIHQGILELLSDDPERFYHDWVYHVRSPTDNSPYFHDFFKWSSLDNFMDTYGENWFQRLELGYIVLVITFLQLALLAFLLILLPVLVRFRQYKILNNKLPTLLHFFMIGTGFMFLEITFIQIFTRFLGDPIFSAAAVICSILIFSGLGSMYQEKMKINSYKRIRIAVIIISSLTLIYLLILNPILSLFIGLDTYWRFLVAILLLFPVSFFLGWMFPSGIDILDKNSDELIPWALAIDSFASVSAAPLALILSMSFGFTNVILLGTGCYIVAGFTSWLWNRA